MSKKVKRLPKVRIGQEFTPVGTDSIGRILSISQSSDKHGNFAVSWSYDHAPNAVYTGTDTEVAKFANIG